MKILGFWHIAKVGYWTVIPPQQFVKFRKSGLWDATDKMYLNFVGSTDSNEIWHGNHGPDGAHSDPKLEITTYADREVFEFPTIGLAQKMALTSPEPFYAYYVHVKGAMTANHFIQNPAYWWGEYMAHYVIERWQECVSKLDEGYDTCGVEWRASPEFHYSGNFWWATSEYLKRLPPMDQYWEQNKHDRIKAEMYIGKANPKAACLKNTGQNLYLYSVTPDQWT